MFYNSNWSGGASTDTIELLLDAIAWNGNPSEKLLLAAVPKKFL